jgi:hypothetical protein
MPNHPPLNDWILCPEELRDSVYFVVLFLGNSKVDEAGHFYFFSKIAIRIGNKKAGRKSTGKIQFLASVNF